MLPVNYVPVKPFPDFKWQWACVQCTEGLNDPVLLLGVLFRMRKLERLNRGIKYSSDEFAKELIDLSNDTKDSVGVDLARRTGNRNLIRNSGQYWRAVGLIPPADRSGRIQLTDFGKKVADHDISQTEFAAITVQTLKLPNPNVQEQAECKKWFDNGLIIYPLRLILSIVYELRKKDKGQGYITPEELIRIVIPLSGCKASIIDYVNFILWFRAGEVSLIGWPSCCTRANDERMAKEFLLFLANYGYLSEYKEANKEKLYYINSVILEEIHMIIAQKPRDESLMQAIEEIRSTEVTAEFERKRVQYFNTTRPHQAAFRRQVLSACKRCVITNVTMPEILEAAHIKPFKYNGENTIANGFAMRTDIHTLFDTGHLRISVDGTVELSNRARMDYGATIPPQINIPSFTNKEFLRWRWDNYNGL